MSEGAERPLLLVPGQNRYEPATRKRRRRESPRERTLAHPSVPPSLCALTPVGRLFELRFNAAHCASDEGAPVFIRDRLEHCLSSHATSLAILAVGCFADLAIGNERPRR